jgi:ATP/maltotriose-dependent transcriptional regulator MalT
VEEAQPNVRNEWLKGGREWLDRLEREHDNLRAALDGLEASSETELAMRLAGALWEFWFSRDHLAEGRRRLESALRADDRPTAARARALNGAAEMAAFAGDASAAKLRAEEALTLHRTLGDALGMAESLQKLGYAVAEEGDPSRARPLLEESVRILRELGNEDYALWTTRTLAWTYHELGDLERAQALHEDNLLRARVLGNEPLKAALLGSLAMIAVKQGRVQDALTLLKENLPIWRDIGERLEIAVCLCQVAHALAAAGRAETAARLLSCSEVLREEVGGSEAWVARMNEETLAAIRAQLDDAAFAEAWEQGRTLTADEAVALALDCLASD